MEKNIFLRCMLTFFLLMGSIVVSAYDFKSDGIYYTIISASDLTVEVAKPEYKSEYSGDITIPATVVYSGKTLKVKRIGSSAFSGCTGLTSVTISNGLTVIEFCSFEDCTRLASVNMSNTLTSIGVGTFYDCKNLASITIPNSVTSIGVGAFDGCTNLGSVTISENLKNLKSGIFRDCTGLTSVTIPNSVTSIDDFAFIRCTGLTSVTIGNSVTSIGERVFNGCTKLSSIYCLNPTPCVINQIAFDNITYLSSTLYVPTNSVSAYQKASGWKNFFTVVGHDFSSVSRADIDAMHVYGHENKVVVENVDLGAVISIYNTSGLLVKTLRALDSHIEIELPINDVYLIKTADKTVKVTL